MDATIIIAIVPVVLLVAYIVWLVRAKITEGRDIDLREPITGVVICLVAVLIIGSMTASTVTYTYSEDTNTLYINQNLIDRNQPFDSYGDEVKSVVIGNNCRLIETGTLDSLTSLEYVSIGKNVEVRNGAFGVSFKDVFDSAVDPESGRYVGTGNGTLYFEDPEMLTYSTNHKTITGLASGFTGAKVLVLPAENSGVVLTAVNNNAFDSSGLVMVLHDPDCMIETIGAAAFRNCSSLESVILPESVHSLSYQAFNTCAALSSFVAEGMQDYGNSAFQGTTAVDLQLSQAAVSIGNSAFNGCAGLTSLRFPATLAKIDTWAFNGCAGITEVSFDAGFAPSNFDAQAFRSWTFYESDGTTLIDKTVASNLAGKTFMGTANALVEVAPGQLNLTPQQLQQVQLHTQELQQQELDIQPLPFQPSLQTQEQEPVAA